MASTNPNPMGPWKVLYMFTMMLMIQHIAYISAHRGMRVQCVIPYRVLCFLQITVYDQENFQGKRMEFTASFQNIMECGFDNIRSLKVECGA